MSIQKSVVIIGAGLIGVSAARYLSAAGSRVVLVGPGETPPGAESRVYSSWYDEARITRILDPDPVWGTLAARSISRYGDIESESGICFHQRSGVLRVADAGDEDLAQSTAACEHLDPVYDVLDEDRLTGRFPMLQFRGGSEALLERGDAGFMNPKRFVKAQSVLCSRLGVERIHATVTRIQERTSGVVVTLEDGRAVQAESALLATGAFTSALHLDVECPPFHISAQTILLAEVAADDAGRFQEMPAVIDRDPGNLDLKYIYVLPPVRYPDGRLCVKIGGRESPDTILDTPKDIGDWFLSGGSARSGERLEEALVSLIPGWAPASLQTKPCAVTRTPTGRPIVDHLSDRIVLAAGGNGAAAKSADEIGRIASTRVLTAAEPPDYPVETFLCRSNLEF